MIEPASKQLISGGSLKDRSFSDPLFPHLIEAMNRAIEIDITVSFILQSGLILLKDAINEISSIRKFSVNIQLTMPRLSEELFIRVCNACSDAEYQSFKLVLVVIPQDSRREIQEDLLNRSVRTINLSKELSRKLVSQSMKDRVKRLRMEVSDIAKECNESVWMSNLDVLFEPSLENDPMILLKKVAKSQVLVAIWPGEITETSLVYSKPGKPDYQSYLLKELNEIQVIDACNGVIK